VLLRACQAYDPDFVVTYSPTVEDIEHFSPGWFSPVNEQGERLVGEERDRLFDMARAQDVPMDVDLVARDQIAAVCSTYRTHKNGQRDENTRTLTDSPGGHFVDVLNMPTGWKGSVLACPEDWGGNLGAAVALHAGVAARPSRDAPEPQLSDEIRNQLALWLLSDGGIAAPDDLVWHPGTAVGIDTRNANTAHDRTLTHLERIATGVDFKRTGLVVLGDTADDFALAHLWRLMFGAGYWIPSALGVHEDRVPWEIGHGVVRIARDLARHSGTLALTSVSRPSEELESIAGRIVAANPLAVLSDGCDGLLAPDDVRDDILLVLPDVELPWRQPMAVGFAVQDQWDSIATVPVSVDEAGTTSMVAPLPPPTLMGADLPIAWDTNWQVDIQWRPGRAVRRRGLDSQELFADRPVFMPTWARSSREGTTYQAKRYDFVQAGIRGENRLARIALRDLSLEAWVAAKCAEHGLTTSHSDAGRRTALLTKMLGGRQAYVEVFGGVLLPAFQAMLPASASTDRAYPDGDGVSLSSREGVLTFEGICARASALVAADVRERVDAALRAGVLRRGLVLLCATCSQKQFVTIDKLGQRWWCSRCDAVNDLDQPAWKLPIEEPIWFYDLHPVGRQLLRDNGDVPALLSAYVRAVWQERDDVFDDVEEVELVSGGEPQIELDLVVYTDDVLSVAECKKSGSELAGRRGREEVRKKCQAAAWLRADRIVFATKSYEWEAAARSAINGGVHAFNWGPLGPPEVIVVSGLGTSAAERKLQAGDS
jgi:hypothetical protein